MNSVLITGGTGSLGRALTPRLIARNCQLGITYILPEEAEAFEAAVQPDPERVLLRRVDSTDADALGVFVNDVAERFGSMDALVALVGGWAGGRDVEDTDDLWFERMLEAYSVLWWIPVGSTPTLEEAAQRLEQLQNHGPSAAAFTFKQMFPPQ